MSTRWRAVSTEDKTGFQWGWEKLNKPAGTQQARAKWISAQGAKEERCWRVKRVSVPGALMWEEGAVLPPLVFLTRACRSSTANIARMLVNCGLMTLMCLSMCV